MIAQIGHDVRKQEYPALYLVISGTRLPFRLSLLIKYCLI